MKDKLGKDKPWFAPKLIGYGAGMPIAWQGWVLLVVFMIALSGDFYLTALAPMPIITRILIRCVLTLAIVAFFVDLARRKTEGGWRWRP